MNYNIYKFMTKVEQGKSLTLEKYRIFYRKISVVNSYCYIYFWQSFCFCSFSSIDMKKKLENSIRSSFKSPTYKDM